MTITKLSHAMIQIRKVLVSRISGLLGRPWDYEPKISRHKKLPKLTYKIKESFFDTIQTLVKVRDSYEKIDGWYHRTIDGPDLSVEFMQDEDCKFVHLVQPSTFLVRGFLRISS